MTNGKKKQPKPVDVHVGQRVRMRRMMLGLSQEKLADGCDLTFQQIQKYEKGSNRIGASRMVQIANILKVPVAFFYEGLAGVGTSKAKTDHDVALQAFLSDRHGVRILDHWAAMTDKERLALATTARMLARGEAE